MSMCVCVRMCVYVCVSIYMRECARACVFTNAKEKRFTLKKSLNVERTLRKDSRRKRFTKPNSKETK